MLTESAELSKPLRVLQGVRIYLVEDDLTTARVYQRWMQDAGAVVEHFATAGAFQERLNHPDDWNDSATLRPQILLMDLILPDGNGLDLIEQWHKKWPQIPVLAVTAFATVDAAVAAMKAGAADVLRKPVETEDLILAMRKAQQHGELLRENQSLNNAVHILSIAQTLASLSDKKTLLKTYLRLITRELKISEGFSFFFDAHRSYPELLLDLRQAGVGRTEPQEIIQNALSPFLRNRTLVPDNVAEMDSVTLVPPTVEGSEDSRFVVVEFKSPTANSGFVALTKDGMTSSALLEAMNQVSPITMQTARTFQNLDVANSLSLLDELTGLYNQRFMDASLSQEVARSQRYGSPVSLLFLDLDRFKSINDTLGHVVGSQMIKAAARTLRDIIRDSDQLLRYGGDEFCVILPNTTLEGAHILAERIRSAFEQSKYDLRASSGVEDAQGLAVTTSIGVASFPESANSVQELIKMADSAMYASKKAGKNCVSLARVRADGLSFLSGPIVELNQKL
jgi:two-component system cell cycle response regulator